MQSAHIYIVDDDETFRKSLKRLLQSAGYFAEDFPSAQSFLDSVPVFYKKGILILDLRMPGMDGFQLQEKLNELRSELGIIFITADAQPGDRDHAIASGAVAFILKPFQEQTLFEMIKSALKSSTDKQEN